MQISFLGIKWYFLNTTNYNVRIFDVINRTNLLYMIYYNFLYHVGAFGEALPKWEQLEFRVKYKISGMSSVGT